MHCSIVYSLILAYSIWAITCYGWAPISLICHNFSNCNVQKTFPCQLCHTRAASVKKYSRSLRVQLCMSSAVLKNWRYSFVGPFSAFVPVWSLQGPCLSNHVQKMYMYSVLQYSYNQSRQLNILRTDTRTIHTCVKNKVAKKTYTHPYRKHTPTCFVEKIHAFVWLLKK